MITAFNAQIILNGHEYLAIAAKRQDISFTREGLSACGSPAQAGNCFTDDSYQRSVGRLVEACERWIYSTCLCFALDLAEQQRSSAIPIRFTKESTAGISSLRVGAPWSRCFRVLLTAHGPRLI
jgi:hypothetical protein